MLKQKKDKDGIKKLYNKDFIELDWSNLIWGKFVLTNIYQLHHICDEIGDLKPEAYFIMLGLSREEIYKVNTVAPFEWKQNVQPLKKSIHSGFSLEFTFSKRVFKIENITAKLVYKSQIK